MSKSILILDTPKKCGECPICASWQSSAFSIREYWCTASENTSVDPDDKPNWCPLKPAPKKQDAWYDDDEGSAWIRGYNNCVREIMSE